MKKIFLITSLLFSISSFSQQKCSTISLETIEILDPLGDNWSTVTGYVERYTNCKTKGFEYLIIKPGSGGTSGGGSSSSGTRYYSHPSGGYTPSSNYNYACLRNPDLCEMKEIDEEF